MRTKAMPHGATIKHCQAILKTRLVAQIRTRINIYIMEKKKLKEGNSFVMKNVIFMIH
jgi:hypothetical protein